MGGGGVGQRPYRGEGEIGDDSGGGGGVYADPGEEEGVGEVGGDGASVRIWGRRRE